MKRESPSDRGESASKVVLFDGRCSLCRKGRQWAAWLDWFGTAAWISFRDPQVRVAVPQLTDEQLEKEMWVVTSRGEMLPGFFGWRNMLLGFPLTFLPALLMYVSPIPFFGKRVYAFIAARRPVSCQIGPSVPVQSGPWESILRRASLSDTTRGPGMEKVAALMFLSFLICVMPLALCSCGKKNTQTATPPRDLPVVKLSPRSNGTVSIVAVGDVLLGSSSVQQLANKGYDWPFENVRSLLSSADLVIGNLAAPITTRTKKLAEEDYTYKVSLASALALKRAGFHALSLGNNHVLDYGVPGLRDTIAVLRTNNIATFGAGENEEAARRGIVCDLGTLRIGLLSYGDEGTELKALAKGKRGGYALLSAKNLAEDIVEMRKRADVVVVSLHWGKNYKDVVEAQEKIGRAAIDLGAHIVCGHHPHIAQGIEIHKGKPILYSLGNFVFGTKGRYPDGKQGYGLVSRWIFEGKSLKWITATPIGINNELVKFKPVRVPSEEAKQALEPHFKRFNTQVRWDGDTAFVGFGSQWQTASLPGGPWKEKSGSLATASQAGTTPLKDADKQAVREGVAP